MEDVRIHRLLGHHYDGEPFSFKMDLKNGRCTNEEIYELLTRGYIESVNTDIPYDIESHQRVRIFCAKYHINR